jgi:hypothetical protein
VNISIDAAMKRKGFLMVFLLLALAFEVYLAYRTLTVPNNEIPPTNETGGMSEISPSVTFMMLAFIAVLTVVALVIVFRMR